MKRLILLAALALLWAPHQAQAGPLAKWIRSRPRPVARLVQSVRNRKRRPLARLFTARPLRRLFRCGR